MTAESKKISVIVIDDSALIRQLLTDILNGAPDIEVVAQAPDALIARDLIKKHNPQVITLDVEMPHMDGLTFLEKMMSLRPMPVIMVSTLTAKGAEATLRALELGAVDYVTKPQTDLHKSLGALTEEIRNKVRIASRARVRPLTQKPSAPPVGIATASIVPKAKPQAAAFASTQKIIAIGSSTGGVEALTEILTHLEADLPAIVITQHMPEKFTASFAQRLNNLCAITVKEAENGDKLMSGHAYIAPGGHQLEIERAGGQFACKVTQDPPVSGHRPSVDVLFRSVARAAGRSALGVILTGMGRDGADGLLAMRNAGAQTLGQDEASCVVYGMPKAAFELKAVEKQLSLTQIAGAITNLIKKASTP